MSDTVAIETIEEEKQRRGQAFLLALRQLEQEYNCSTTTVPRWEPCVTGTFVLAFDEQVLVGPPPASQK